MKKTLIIGASEKPERYSNIAIRRLRAKGHEVIAIGNRKGKVDNVEFSKERPTNIENLDTVSLYVNPKIQTEYYDYILSLKPKRIVFNPGTENSELQTLAREAGIDTLEACTLVLLSTGQY